MEIRVPPMMMDPTSPQYDLASWLYFGFEWLRLSKQGVEYPFMLFASIMPIKAFRD